MEQSIYFIDRGVLF